MKANFLMIAAILVTNVFFRFAAASDAHTTLMKVYSTDLFRPAAYVVKTSCSLSEVESLNVNQVARTCKLFVVPEVEPTSARGVELKRGNPDFIAGRPYLPVRTADLVWASYKRFANLGAIEVVEETDVTGPCPLIAPARPSSLTIFRVAGSITQEALLFVSNVSCGYKKTQRQPGRPNTREGRTDQAWVEGFFQRETPRLGLLLEGAYLQSRR